MGDKVFPPLNFTMIEENLYRSALPSPINYTFIRSLKLKTIVVLSENIIDDFFLAFCKENDISLLLPHSLNNNAAPTIPTSSSNSINNNINNSTTNNTSITSVTPPSVPSSSSTVVANTATAANPPSTPLTTPAPVPALTPFAATATATSSSPPNETVSEEAVTSSLRLLLDSRNYPLLLTCRSGRSQCGVVVGCLRKLMRWSLIAAFEEYRRFSSQNLRLTLTHEAFIEQFDMETIDSLLLQQQQDKEKDKDKEGKTGVEVGVRSDLGKVPDFLLKFRG